MSNHPAPGRCVVDGCSLMRCRLHGLRGRHPKPCGPKKDDAQQPRAQPLAVPRQALHQGRHRHARDGDAQAEPPQNAAPAAAGAPAESAS